MFDLQLTGLVGAAADFFNGLSPIIIIIGGVAVGMMLFVTVFSLVLRLRQGW